MTSTRDASPCPHCTGRGWIFHADFTVEPCLCGGTDEDRIELDERESDIAVIKELSGDLATDQQVFDHVRRQLGHHAFVDEALALMASEYQRLARYDHHPRRRLH